MRAWVYKGPYEMAIEQISCPKVGPSDVRVRITAVGLCGSDIHGFSGQTGVRNPGTVMGHEVAGEVAELGFNVVHLDMGQQVVVQPIIYCGSCEACKSGKTNICPHKRMVGVNMDTIGGMSDFLVVPARNVLPISNKVPARAATLVESFAAGAGAVRCAGELDGRNVVIVGAGVVGVTTLLMARESSPEKIFIVDNSTRRLKVAEQLGAQPINFSYCDAAKEVLDRTHGVGAEVSFEAAGLTSSLRTAVNATKAGGKVVCIGNSQQTVEVDLQDIVANAKSIQGVYCYTDEDFRKAVAYVEKNRDLVTSFAEETARFEAAQELLTKLAKGEMEVFRAVVTL